MGLRRDTSAPRGASREAPKRNAAKRFSLGLSSLSLHWLRPVAMGAVVLGVVLGLVQLSGFVYPLLDRPLSRVEVSSELKYQPSAGVENALAPLVGQSFFALDLEQMRQQLLALPWVAKANVSRRWPDRLVLELTEQQPLARWGEQGLLNLDGELFTPASLTGFEKLPKLSGPPGSEALVMEQFHELGYLLRPLGLSISQLRLSNRNTWSLQLGRVQVAVGGGDVATRLKRFVRLYRQQLKSCWPMVERIDLRYDNGVAVSQREACAA